MASTVKVSVSLGAPELRWARARAKKRKTSVSALLTDALRREQQMEARRAFLARLEPDERASEADAAAIQREWQG